MTSRTPRRLLDGAGPSRLASALARAEADLGSADDLARMRAKLAPHIAHGSIEGSSVVQAGSGSAAGKAAAWIAAGTLVLSGVAWLSYGATAPAAAPVQPRPMQVEAAVPAAAANAKPLAGPAEESMPVPASASEASREPQSVAALPRAGSSSRKPRPLERPTAPPATAGAVDDELQLLRRAQDAIDTRPRAALAVLDEHAQVYPHGVFAQERESLAIDALRKLGRRQDAIARTHTFMARHPKSPHARRLLSWLQSTAEDSNTDADRLPAP